MYGRERVVLWGGRGEKFFWLQKYKIKTKGGDFFFGFSGAFFVKKIKGGVGGFKWELLFVNGLVKF